jgi:hypothetical protein
MSASERLLSPKCQCGKAMRLVSRRPMPQRRETHINIYHCAKCDHEMRVTVWGADVQAA